MANMPVPAKGPIETKVAAATGGSLLGVALSGFIIWLLDEFAFDATAVPDAVTALVLVVFPMLSTFVSGYLARHTPRNDLQAQETGDADGQI